MVSMDSYNQDNVGPRGRSIPADGCLSIEAVDGNGVLYQCRKVKQQGRGHHRGTTQTRDPAPGR